MERLTHIGSNGEIWITDNDETRRLGRKEAAYKKLAEYEDLEEQGLLLKLPCKVGDRVYEIYRFLEEGAWEIDVHKIRLEDLEKIGKTVFLTQAEAEEVLKRMEREGCE